MDLSKLELKVKHYCNGSWCIEYRYTFRFFFGFFTKKSVEKFHSWKELCCVWDTSGIWYSVNDHPVLFSSQEKALAKAQEYKANPQLLVEHWRKEELKWREILEKKAKYDQEIILK